MPLRHQSRVEKGKELEGKVKDRCTGTKSKLLLYLPAPRQRQYSHCRKRAGTSTGKETR